MAAVREDLQIAVGGETIAAWHYPGSGRAALVMAHGFCGTRDAGLEPIADAFSAAGFDVVLFDYRGFGSSSGSPRQLPSVAGQLQDFGAVVAWARGLGLPVALWGYSLGGAHVLRLAGSGEAGAVAATIALAPVVDAATGLLSNLRWSSPAGLGGMLGAAARDAVAARRGRPRVLCDAVGPRGSAAVLTSPDALDGYLSLAAGSATWRNEFCAAFMWQAPRARVMRYAKRVTSPLLVQVADGDLNAPPGIARRAGARGTVLSYEGLAHFSIAASERVRADAVAWLEHAL